MIFEAFLVEYLKTIGDQIAEKQQHLSDKTQLLNLAITDEIRVAN